MTELTIYPQRGYQNRNEYLKELAEKYGVPENDALALAELFGEEEDFDGLVTAVEYKRLQIEIEELKINIRALKGEMTQTILVCPACNSVKILVQWTRGADVRECNTFKSECEECGWEGKCEQLKGVKK